MKRGDERKVIKSLKKSKKENLFLLSYVSGTLHKCPLEYVSDYPYRCQLKIQVPLIFISQFIDNLKSNGEATFFVESMSCMFKSTVQSFDHKTGLLVISYPKKVIFHNRREDNRIVLSKEMMFLYNQDNGLVLRKNVYDLCMGGISVAFSQVENLRLKEGEVLKNVFFQYDNDVQYIDIKVLNILKPSRFELEAMPYAFRRVSFTFVLLDDNQKSFIEKIIQIESGLQKKKSS